MRLTRFFALLLWLVPLTASSAAPLWTRVVAATPEGGFRIGNPKAKVKLVEYGSLTCPHCRAFDQEAWLPLSAYVRRGNVSFEYRNYVLNGVDVAAALVARCGGAASFFPTARELYATQPQWIGKITGLSDAEKDAINKLPDAERTARVAEVSGIMAIARKHGISAVRARKCLADPQGMNRLDQIHDAAQDLGVSGTPTFFVNGRMVDGIGWSDVQAALKSAGG